MKWILPGEMENAGMLGRRREGGGLGHSSSSPSGAEVKAERMGSGRHLLYLVGEV